ncbi:atos homolog protein A-like [Amphiura filiformis]|uniref:atos homolog protein A-like n=1 Tax=Amphiura filiformis TaxID=82378 RepID=UPI003B221707
MQSAVASYQCPPMEMEEASEMVEIDAKQLFVDMGMLILEGRTPEQSMKGRSEGEHCPPLMGRPTHFCVPSAAKCKQMEAVRAYIWFLCRNDIPMSVEVLLYPDCCYAKDVEIEIGAAAESGSTSPLQPAAQPDHLLIEQWIVQVLPKRSPQGQCFSNILLQAVRSFLHFSQLSAWLSSSHGKMYNNIVYRVCAPGDSYSTDFISKPDIHTFPVLNISKSSSVRVSVASLPRQKYMPAISCQKDGHITLKKTPPSSPGREAPLYQHVRLSDLYPQVEQSLTRRQRSVEDLKFEFQQRNPTWRQKHSSGEDNSTSSSSEEDQAEKIRQKKAACAPKLEVVLPEVYRQQGAVPKSRTPTKSEQQPTLEEDSAKYLGQSDWCLPPGTPASLYKSEHQASPSPDVHRQLFSMPIPTKKSSRDDVQENKLTRSDRIASTPELEPNRGGLGLDAFNSQINKSQFCDRLSSFTTPLDQESLVPNYYDTTSFSSMQSINEQLSSLSLLECSTDVCADTSTDDNDDAEEDGGAKDDDIDWQWNIDDRTPRQRTSSERTLSTEEEDNGIMFSAKSSDDFDDVVGGEEFWDSSSSWTDDVIIGSHLDNYSEISDDDSFVSCLSGSYSSSPCVSSFTPRQQLEAQFRQHLKHKDEATALLTKPGSSPNSPARLGAIAANRSSPKHDKLASPIRTTCKLISSSNKDSPTHKPSPTSSPRHNRTRGLSLDSQDFKADIPAPFHRPVPTPSDGGPPVCVGSPFTPVFSKSKSLLRNVIGKENIPQPKQVESGVLSDLNKRPSPPRSPDRTKFRRSFDSSNTYVFHPRTGLPINSSPAPLRKAKTTNDCAALLKPGGLKSSPSCNDLEDAHTPLCQSTRVLSTSAPASTSCLLGNFEESVLNGRLEPLGTIDGFTAEIGASGSFCPKHIELPVTTFFYSVSDDDAPSSYFGYVNLENIGRRGYHIPKCGTVQVTLFNPNKTVVKMFVMRYDLSDMPPNCQTFARQRIFYMPSNADLNDDCLKELRYLMHLRFQSSKSGKIYLHTDIRMIFARHTPDLECSLGTYELRSFTETPLNPRFSPKK